MTPAEFFWHPPSGRLDIYVERWQPKAPSIAIGFDAAVEIWWAHDGPMSMRILECPSQILSVPGCRDGVLSLVLRDDSSVSRLSLARAQVQVVLQHSRLAEVGVRLKRCGGSYVPQSRPRAPWEGAW